MTALRIIAALGALPLTGVAAMMLFGQIRYGLDWPQLILGLTAASLVGEIPLRFPLGAFYVDLGSGVRVLGLVAALAVGVLGGIVPAVRAIRMPLPDALGGKL